MLKLIIFDLDGTLVNSLDDLGNACNSALERFGYPVHSIEEYRYFVGDGVSALIERALPEGERSPGNAERVREVFNGIYEKTYNRLTKPYDGIIPLLERLREKGMLTAVASNKPDGFTRKITDSMFGELLDFASGKKDGFEKKPDPAIVLHIMDKLGAKPDETLIAGDSSVDMHTAANAGCKSIGCTWGFRTLKELTDSGADYIAHSPDDIFSIAEKLILIRGLT